MPAKHAVTSPVKYIFTHFPKTEQKLIGEVRLGEELRELSGIFKIITDNSLLFSVFLYTKNTPRLIYKIW